MRSLRIAFLAATVACFSPASSAWAGLYSGPTDTTHAIDPAISASSPLFVEWANAILPVGSGTYFAPRGSTSISTTGYNSLGDLDATQIANGDSPGYLTVTFPNGIRNGAGADFAVFENGFQYGSPNGLFLELAYVDVSTNGVDFARFPSISTNTAPVAGSGAFAGYDTSNIYNLAGKHANGFGTPFNLDDLLNDRLVQSGAVNLDYIRYVRLFDIPGNGSFLDSLGNPILDNWLTTGAGGFDFRLPAGQGIGVINSAVPEPGTFAIFAIGAAAAFSIGRRRWRHRG
ncbi:MAG: PEP-CTERM sorting domain-containing protein [Thermoguttaceae bacterium]|nr:PEP-CTERM sorting domain-containing protein [Thermoguttaceae bacterium]